MYLFYFLNIFLSLGYEYMEYDDIPWGCDYLRIRPIASLNDIFYYPTQILELSTLNYTYLLFLTTVNLIYALFPSNVYPISMIVNNQINSKFILLYDYIKYNRKWIN